MIDEVPNDKLKALHVPDAHSDWPTIWKFALSFNGYRHHGGHEECAEIANSQRNETLTDLRTCLYFEQRRWHHFGEDPDEEAEGYIRDLVRQIRNRLNETT